MLHGSFRAAKLPRQANCAVEPLCHNVSQPCLRKALSTIDQNFTQTMPRSCLGLELPMLHGFIWSQYLYLYYVYTLMSHWQNTNCCGCDTSTTMNIIWQHLTYWLKFCTCCSMMFWQSHKLQSSHIKLSTVLSTNMQLLIASVLVLAMCAARIATWR